MNILVSNDDGIDSLGIIQLVNELSKFSNVYVVAPENQRSSHSHHLTIKGKIRYEQRKFPKAKKAYSLWGTPADCVSMALKVLIDEKIDLVVAGINNGANISTDIIYSGTIAAAREAFLSGVPAMAISLNNYDSKDFKVAAKYAGKIVKDYMKMKDNHKFFLNVNVPDLKEKDIKGIKVCHEHLKMNYNDSYCLKKIYGKDYIVIIPNKITYDYNPDKMSIDANALKSGYVTISALHNEHVSPTYTKTVKEYFKE